MLKSKTKVQLLLLVALACLLTIEFYVVHGRFRLSFAQWLRPFLPLEPRLLHFTGWAAGCTLLYLVIPAAFLKGVLRERLGDHGLTFKGFGRHIWIYVGLYIPVAAAIIFVSRWGDFQKVYPFYMPTSMGNFLIWELAYALQFIALEFFFRGFILHGARRQFGDTAAIWIMLFPYTMIHYPKPLLEACSAVVAGYILARLSLRTGSIFGGAAIHIAVAWTMDVLALWQRGWLQLRF